MPHYVVSDLGLHCLSSHKNDSILIWVKVTSTIISPPVISLSDEIHVSQHLLKGIQCNFVFFVSCVSRAFASVHCCLVVTCWERADLLALVGDVNFICVAFPCGILGQVLYLIVSFPDLCRLSYFT